MDKFSLGISLALISAIGWSFNGVLARLAVNVGSFGVVLNRDIVGFSFFIIIVLFRGKLSELKSIFSRPKLFIVIAITYSLNSLFGFIAYKQTFIASSSVLTFTFPIIIAIFSPFVLKEKIRLKEVGGVFLSVLGVIIIFYTTSSVFSNVIGNISALSAATCFASYSLILRKIRSRPSIEVFMVIIFGFSILLITILGILLNQSFFTYATQTDFLYLLALGFIGGVIGHTSYNLAVKYVKPHIVGTMTLTAPIMAAILALIILIELPPMLTLFGVTISLAGIFITVKTTPRIFGNRQQK